MTTITFDPTDIQIVDLPAAFPDAEQAAYAWAQHRGITNNPVVGYAVIQTDKHGEDPVEVVGLYEPTYYAGAVEFVRHMTQMEADAALQFHEIGTRYVFRTANVYDHGGKPTIVL